MFFNTKEETQSEENNYWISYSDMMSALLLVFILLMIFSVLKFSQSKEIYVDQKIKVDEQQVKLQEKQEKIEEQQELINKMVGVRADIIKELKEAFENTNLQLTIDEKTGSIAFSNGVFFDTDKDVIKESGKAYLDEFIPKYLEVVLSDNFKDYVCEIIIEGHTDTQGDYIYNLDLSQRRSYAVIAYILKQENILLQHINADSFREIISSNGRSYSDPIYNQYNTIDMEASRRVEVKFRLADQEMIDQLHDILED